MIDIRPGSNFSTRYNNVARIAMLAKIFRMQQIEPKSDDSTSIFSSRSSFMGPESGPIPLARITYDSPPQPRQTSIRSPREGTMTLLGVPTGIVENFEI